MPRSVTLTTPIPTLEELRTSLGISKARERSLLRILETGAPDAGERSNGRVGRRRKTWPKASPKSKRAAAAS